MATVKVRLKRATRVEGVHVEAGQVVELDGRDPKTGELTGDARYCVGVGIAEEVTESDAKAAKAAK